VVQVKVRADGFKYDGQVDASLSAAAKAVIGSHCNGFVLKSLPGRGCHSPPGIGQQRARRTHATGSLPDTASADRAATGREGGARASLEIPGRPVVVW